MADNKLTLEELLHEFPANQLGYALVSAGLPGDGSKNERVRRLLESGRQQQVQAAAVLELFKANSLRRICTQFGLQRPTKGDMVHVLCELLRADERQLTFAPPLRTAPSFPGVVGYLRRLVLPGRRIRSEADAE